MAFGTCSGMEPFWNRVRLMSSWCVAIVWLVSGGTYKLPLSHQVQYASLCISSSFPPWCVVARLDSLWHIGSARFLASLRTWEVCFGPGWCLGTVVGTSWFLGRWMARANICFGVLEGEVCLLGRYPWDIPFLYTAFAWLPFLDKTGLSILCWKCLSGWAIKLSSALLDAWAVHPCTLHTIEPNWLRLSVMREETSGLGMPRGVLLAFLLT